MWEVLGLLVHHGPLLPAMLGAPPPSGGGTPAAGGDSGASPAASLAAILASGAAAPAAPPLPPGKLRVHCEGFQAVSDQKLVHRVKRVLEDSLLGPSLEGPWFRSDSLHDYLLSRDELQPRSPVHYRIYLFEIIS